MMKLQIIVKEKKNQVKSFLYPMHGAFLQFPNKCRTLTLDKSQEILLLSMLALIFELI